MIVPLLLIVAALVCAAVAGYGTDGAWISYSHGLDLICLSRRLQWPLYTLCLLACFALILLVVSGKRRAWWLLGLVPVVVLFAHRFTTSPMRDFAVADNPALVSTDDPNAPADDDYVVGALTPEGTPVAYPYVMLYRMPIVVQSTGDQRMLLVWNPFANVARAAAIDRDIRASELEVTSMPANATLVYNARYGQFINGITLRQPNSAQPAGLLKPLDTYAMPFGRWKTLYPSTKVWPLTRSMVQGIPPVPLAPRYKIPHGDGSGGKEGGVVLVATTRPVALLHQDVADIPLNLNPDNEPVVVYRDPNTRLPRAFSRDLSTGEQVRFAPIPDFLKPPPATFMLDTLAQEPWTASGKHIELPPPPPPPRTKTNPNPVQPPAPEMKFKGLTLKPLQTYEGGYLEVLKFWLPNLQVITPSQELYALIPPPPPPPPPERKPPIRRKKPTRH